MFIKSHFDVYLERENDRSQTEDVHSNAQAPVYIWKTGLALFRWFTCYLGVYIYCVLLNIIFIFFLEIIIPMFPLSTCTCTADFMHRSYSMEFFYVHGYGLHRLSCKIFAHQYLLVISVASNSFRSVVLSFKFYSSLHLYCYFEKKSKLAAHVCKYMTVRSFLFTLGCLRSGVKSTVTLIGFLIYGV